MRLARSRLAVAHDVDVDALQKRGHSVRHEHGIDLLLRPFRCDDVLWIAAFMWVSKTELRGEIKCYAP